MQFYKSTNNTGTHKGEVWENDDLNNPGTSYLLGQVTFTNETSSGWQTATFSNPIYVLPGQTYIVDYTDPNGHYSADNNAFNGNYPTAGALQAVAPGALWKTDVTNNDPPVNVSGQDTNYYVDAIFQQFVPEESLFNETTATPQVAPVNDFNDVEVGTRFTSAVQTQVTGVRYWMDQGFWHNPQVDLWQNGILITSAVQPDKDMYTGWAVVYFSSPVTIQPNTEYVVSYFNARAEYGETTNFFTSPYTHGEFTAPTNAGVYIDSATSAFPTNQTSTNFWVDPVFSTEIDDTVSATVDPTFSFTVANQNSVCNGESNSVVPAGTATTVALDHLAAANNVSGGQALSVSGNAGGGFVVYIRGTQASQNLRNAGHNWTDVAGSYASPSVLGAGERFGYTYKDSTTSSSVTNPASANFIALTNAATNGVMGSASSTQGTGCVSFDAQTGATTPAGSYAAAIVYTAVPSF